MDENSVLSGRGDNLNEKTMKKLSQSRHDKDVVLYKLYIDFMKKGNKLEKSTCVIIKTPFVQEGTVMQRGDMLKTIDGPMQLIHADSVDLNFFSKSVVRPIYCLKGVPAPLFKAPTL